MTETDTWDIVFREDEQLIGKVYAVGIEGIIASAVSDKKGFLDDMLFFQKAVLLQNMIKTN